MASVSQREGDEQVKKRKRKEQLQVKFPHADKLGSTSTFTALGLGTRL